jgi:hypothetical protein
MHANATGINNLLQHFVIPARPHNLTNSWLSRCQVSEMCQRVEGGVCVVYRVGARRRVEYREGPAWYLLEHIRKTRKKSNKTGRYSGQ